MAPHPERLNLAIAKRCHVSCSGCYTVFGKKEPDLTVFLSSVAAFVDLGIRDVTVSGGDPLTICDLPDFCYHLRSLGVNSIKVDTVGVGLQQASPVPGGPSWGLQDLMRATDFLGIPLDGWSNESVLLFRRGRPDLYEETVALLTLLDELGHPPRVIINTVAHRGNLAELDHVGIEVMRHAAVCHWNVFQYTATDQTTADINHRFCVSDEEFESTRAHFHSRFPESNIGHSYPCIAFRSSASRLGQYLLINGDGEAWLPDAAGRTVPLGLVFGAEERVLKRWADAISAIHEATHSVTQRPAAYTTGAI